MSQTMINILSDVICSTFMTACGKNQCVKPEGERKAFKMEFNVSIDHEKEEGYRWLEVVIYGPMNYVGVWVREVSNVISMDDMEYDEAEEEYYPKEGKNYIKSKTPWVQVTYHDSGWRNGVKRLLTEKDPFISNIHGSDWFKLVDPKTLNLPE